METEKSANSCIESIYCNSAKEFLDVLSLANPMWGEGLNRPWLFRGHADGQWKLVPPSWRADAAKFYAPLIKRFSALASERLREEHGQLENENTYVQLMAQSAAEVEAVNSFGWLADAIGLLGLGMDDLDISGSEYIESVAKNDVLDVREISLSHVHALAQHHGIPTRLLDWTRRPEIAAYFSVRELEKGRDSDNVAVWALNCDDTIGRPRMPNVAYLASYSDKKLSLLVSARKNSEYIHAQHGLLIYHTACNKHYLEHGVWPAFEDVLQGMWESGEAKSRPLRKVLLSRCKTLEVRRLLWRQETTEAHLMPSYDAVVRSLIEKWSIE